ncbi:MAG: MFS transporter [Planctomycetota bacterium]|jgi:MFS family permease
MSVICLEQSSVDLDPPPQADPPDPHVRRNYVLGVLSGAAGTMSFSFLHPELLLAGMVYALTGNRMLVALVTVVSKAGILAPQLLVGARLEHYRIKRPYFLTLAAVRLAALGGMIVCMTQLQGGSLPAALWVFFVAYLAACVCGGAGHVVFMDMAGRMVPTRRVGSYFGLRHFLGGGMAALLAVILIQPILGVERLSVPMRYLIVVAVGVVLSVANVVLFALCREQPGPRARRQTTLVESLRRGVGWLKSDPDYRAYFWQRIAFRISYLGLAFYIPFGADTLARDRSEVALLGGIMVATITLSRTGASAVWGAVADRYGYRRCLLGGGMMFTVAPILALAAPALPEAFSASVPFVPVELTLPLLVYLAALVALGIAMQATVIGGSQFLMTTAPPHRRISYTGFPNTVTSPLTLLPLAGAWLAGTAGVRTLFLALIAGGMAYTWAAVRMKRRVVPPTR